MRVWIQGQNPWDGKAFSKDLDFFKSSSRKIRTRNKEGFEISMSENITYQKETINELREKFQKVFNLASENVWADGNCVYSVEHGRKSYHDLKFTLIFPENFYIGREIRVSQAEFGWSIFHSCSIDYSKHTQTVSIEFQISYETCQNILGKPVTRGNLWLTLYFLHRQIKLCHLISKSIPIREAHWKSNKLLLYRFTWVTHYKAL